MALPILYPWYYVCVQCIPEYDTTYPLSLVLSMCAVYPCIPEYDTTYTLSLVLSMCAVYP